MRRADTWTNRALRVVLSEYERVRTSSDETRVRHLAHRYITLLDRTIRHRGKGPIYV